ncbi:MAG: 6-carboxytetrahydropterin synthase [Thiohalocapsa sp.]|uniref:6-pyruvoyl trahydropterin synthase family protein n=1 Tax=Thiohalocapsa sp. TaxID=2497641 RepID=UPI0025CCEE44|nr:6-carboxytetrahydropterin synthase [Thiohalocapsa sp.]MCG6942144.1 6-carboxytetrahydropterin synthase [Thiohalocapsa sp.]
MNEQLFHTAATVFEAALRVPVLPDGHRAARLHGHSYRARVWAALPPGWAAAGDGFAGGETDALGAALAAAVAPLDYADLNAHLPAPTDENLARWVHRRLAGAGVPGIATVGIRSTADTGADLAPDGHAHLWHRFRFEAAHRLPRVPEGHPCGRMHGHGFEVILHVDQALGEQGADADMGIDFDRIAALFAPLHAELDHACLNDIAGLENPTSELLCRWLWQRLKPQLPALSWVTVYETATAGCHFDGAHYRIWKELRFESALRLEQAPEGDGRRRLHGHSYVLRLHLSAELDDVLGWTVDYGDVKALFKPVYERLDHHRLDSLVGPAGADPAGLARWIRTQAAADLPWLGRIDLQQTPGCGAVLCWGELGPALPV